MATKRLPKTVVARQVERFAYRAIGRFFDRLEIPVEIMVSGGATMAAWRQPRVGPADKCAFISEGGQSAARPARCGSPSLYGSPRPIAKLDPSANNAMTAAALFSEGPPPAI